MKRLTPDNEERADRAESALDAAATDVDGNETDPDRSIAEQVTDLIGDLWHFCDRHGVRMQECIDAARNHHECEIEDWS